MTDSAVSSPTRRRVNGVSLSEMTPAEPTDAVPIVLVHGGCHGAWQFETTQQEFARLGRVSIAIDWLNHGDSDPIPEDEWLRRGIESVVHEVGVAVDAAPEPPVLFGHSMGGMAATLYAVQNPGKIRALVLGTPVIPKKYAGPALDVPIDPDLPWGPPPFEQARALFYDSVSDERAAEIYPRLRSESPAACLQATRWTIETDIDSVTVPIMVLTGEKDELTPSEPIVRMAEALGAHHVSMPGTGHGIIFDERWPDYCEKINSWIEESLAR